MKPSASWCLLRSSGRLRAAIKYKIEKSGLTLTKIADDLDITHGQLSLYLTNNLTTKVRITQHTLMRLCIYLHIRVELHISSLDDDSFDGELLNLKH